MSTSPNFTKYCSEFIDKAVLVVLEAQKRVHLTQKRKATYNPDESMSTINVPDYLRFIFHIQEDIKHLNEFENLLEFLQKNSKFSGTRADFERIVLLVLGRFLEIISAQQGVIQNKLNSENFTALTDIVQDLKDYLQADYLDVIHRMPLLFFTSNLVHIEIGDNLVIRKLTNQDREEFSVQFRDAFLTSSMYEYIVELVRKVKRTHIDPDHQEPSNMDLTAPVSTQIISSLITSLRLIEGKYVD